MYYLAADPTNPLFSQNLIFCKGVLRSPSLMRLIDENLTAMVSMYECFHTDREKEKVFETVRKKHYPDRPSRMGAIFLFNDLETALSANKEWWKDERQLYETKINNGSVVMVADFQWLNCTEAEYEDNAHSYFKEEQTDNPLIEIVVMGTIEVSHKPINT